MAVNLTKPTEMREYTPVHILDEEDTMPKSSLETIEATPEASLHIEVVPETQSKGTATVSDNQFAEAMTTMLTQIENADVQTQEEYYKELKSAVKKTKDQIKLSKKQRADNSFILYVKKAVPKMLILALVLLGLLNKEPVFEFISTNIDSSFGVTLNNLFTMGCSSLGVFLCTSFIYDILKHMCKRP